MKYDCERSAPRSDPGDYVWSNDVRGELHTRFRVTTYVVEM
jgi:hypothetical protein